MTSPSLVSIWRDLTRPRLVCFSHLRWDFVFQRPQHLLTRASERYELVFFEEPLGGTKHFEEEVLDRGEHIRVVRLRTPDNADPADIVACQVALAERIVAEATGFPLVFWHYTPMALEFSRNLRRDVTVFDKMDELSAFKASPPELLALEAELLERADLVFTGGASLHAAAAGRHHNIHCFPSSIDAAHFAQAHAPDRQDPADQSNIPHPRIGFFGVIDERLDAALLGEVARHRPDWQLVIIGPVVKIDETTLPRAPNLHWLGGKPYAELPAYLGGWDAGFMPFALNEATRFISPTKTPEFLAAGLPVVSTPITDIVHPYGNEGLVEIAADAPAVIAALERVLACGASPEWRVRVEARLASSSWDSTWEAMAALIDACRPTTSLRVSPINSGHRKEPERV